MTQNMNNLEELLQLYDLTNLPKHIQKERELKRWREIMEQQKYEQEDLPGMLEAEAEARESGISESQKQKHLAQWGLKFEKYAKFSKDPIFRMRMMDQRNKCFDMMTIREKQKTR